MSDYYIKSERKPKEHTKKPPPKVSINDMLTIADAIHKETGHYPSFGEVQTGIDYGHINPKKYLKKDGKRR